MGPIVLPNRFGCDYVQPGEETRFPHVISSAKPWVVWWEMSFLAEPCSFWLQVLHLCFLRGQTPKADSVLT